jgi:hypothetical protein
MGLGVQEREEQAKEMDSRCNSQSHRFPVVAPSIDRNRPLPPSSNRLSSNSRLIHRLRRSRTARTVRKWLTEKIAAAARTMNPAAR